MMRIRGGQPGISSKVAQKEPCELDQEAIAYSEARVL